MSDKIYLYNSKLSQNNLLVLVFAILCLVLSCSGCSNGDQPDLGRVSGVVTVDGKPTAGLGLLFSQQGFRSSSGYTNEAGEYNLNYIRETMGAVVGNHSVRIDFLPQEGLRGPRKKLPERYNRETELSREVEPGSNEINFDLQSQ